MTIWSHHYIIHHIHSLPTLFPWFILPWKPLQPVSTVHPLLLHMLNRTKPDFRQENNPFYSQPDKQHRWCSYTLPCSLNQSKVTNYWSSRNLSKNNVKSWVLQVQVSTHPDQDFTDQGPLFLLRLQKRHPPLAAALQRLIQGRSTDQLVSDCLNLCAQKKVSCVWVSWEQKVKGIIGKANRTHTMSGISIFHMCTRDFMEYIARIN